VAHRRQFTFRRRRVEVGKSEEILGYPNVLEHLAIARLEDVERQRHAGEQDHRQWKQWETVHSTHFVASFAHLFGQYARDYVRAAGRSQSRVQKNVASAPCWATPRRPSSTPSDEEGFTYGVGRTSKGVTSGSSKNVSEQLQPVHRRQLTNRGQHVFELERLRKEAVSACG